MRTMSRYEFKYALHPGLYHRIKAQLHPYMRPDPYTYATGGYWVRSLYWDDLGYSAYWEKAHGDCYRCKLRIRAYGREIQDISYLSLELKTKMGDRTEKFSNLVRDIPQETTVDWNGFFRRLQTDSNPVTREFLRRVHSRALFPKLMVEYYRTGYVARDGSPLRLTFDQKTASVATKELFPKNTRLRPHGPAIILEIKTGTDVPFWLRRLIQDNGLVVQKNSKYAQAVENSSFDVVKQARPPT